MKFEDDGPTVTLSLQAGAEVRVDESLGQNGGERDRSRFARLRDSDGGGPVQHHGRLRPGRCRRKQPLRMVPVSIGRRRRFAPQRHGRAGRMSCSTRTATTSSARPRAAATSSSASPSIRASGAVTLTQYRAMVHGNPDDSDELSTPLSIASGLVSAVRTITDGDGDHDAKSADIGPAMKFEDDRPTVTLSLHSGAEVRVDESLTAKRRRRDRSWVRLARSRNPRHSCSIPRANFGKDGMRRGATRPSGPCHSRARARLALNDTASGQDVLLYKVGNDIVGKTATGGDLVFRIAIDSVERCGDADPIPFDDPWQCERFRRILAPRSASRPACLRCSDHHRRRWRS